MAFSARTRYTINIVIEIVESSVRRRRTNNKRSEQPTQHRRVTCHNPSEGWHATERWQKQKGSHELQILHKSDPEGSKPGIS